MATRTWRGGAARVAGVQTYAFGGTWEADDLIRASFANGKRYDFTAGSTTTATVVAGIVTAWNALSAADYPEFAEITASASTTTLTLTHDTTGKSFAVTLTPLEANGGAADAQTIEGAGTATTGTVSTAASGPNFWSVATNWAEAAVPVTGDDVVINDGPSILYGLAQSAVTLATLTIGPGFPQTSQIGLPSNTSPTNPANGYPEHRDQRLAVGATVVSIETQSRRIRLDLTAAPTTVTVRDTGNPEVQGERALDLKLDNAGGSTAAYFLKGNVGVNQLPGDTGTVADVNVSYRTTPASDVSLVGGPALTTTRLDQAGGDVWLQKGPVTTLKADGTLTVSAGAMTTVTNRGGLFNHDGTGTITTLANKGRFVRRGLAVATVTDCTLYAGSRTEDANGVLAWTNPPQFYECRLAAGPDDRGPDVCWANFGVHRKLTVANI